jgi:hypothetical protein
MAESDEFELTTTERQALHELQLGIENLYRGYGSLLEFHHLIGRGMDHIYVAEKRLREAGHEAQADSLRDEALPVGIFEDTWSYEVVESFKREFLADVSGFEREIRKDLADGKEHITERRQQREWHDRAEDN